MKAPLYNQKGEKKGDVTLNKAIFEVEPSAALAHLYLMYQRSNARNPLAHVKNKSEVSGGGRKPFRQKGTGRARQGSTRNPHMRGGGNAFGPKKWQTFDKMMPKQMRRKALFSLLSVKAKDGQVLALDKFELKAPKTKDYATLLGKLPVKRNVLVVIDREEEMLKMSASNQKDTKVILANYLNPADLMKFETLLVTEAALKTIDSNFASK